MKNYGKIKVLMVVVTLLVLLIIAHSFLTVFPSAFLSKEESSSKVFEITRIQGQNSTVLDNEEYVVKLYFKRDH